MFNKFRIGYKTFIVFILLIFCVITFILYFTYIQAAKQSCISMSYTSDIATKDAPSEPIILDGISTPIVFPELDYKLFYNTTTSHNYLKILLNACTNIEYARIDGKYSSIAVVAMEEEYTRLQKIYKKIQVDITNYTAWESEYYYAAKTFGFLKENGYTDAVACGILGNMMVETAGGTLLLNPTIYNPSGKYYGLCQWSLLYYP